MNKHIKASLSLAIMVAVLASCQPNPPKADEKNASNASEDTGVSQNRKPDESGYADINGLKMYYEVYGKGKPIVLLHGSFLIYP